MDINADLGEGCGSDSALMGIVTSANIACGGHFGDLATMREAVDRAMGHGVSIGAHPSYPDREGFGRRAMQCTLAQIQTFVRQQTEALLETAAAAGTTVDYVKPHGALGNLAAIDRTVADAIVESLHALDPSLCVLAMASSSLETSARERGVRVFAEIYADRAYTDAGTLVPRGEKGAVLNDDAIAIDRLRIFLRTRGMAAASGRTIDLPADSICVHGDNPHAVLFARRVRELLQVEGVRVAPFCG